MNVEEPPVDYNFLEKFEEQSKTEVQIETSSKKDIETIQNEKLKYILWWIVIGITVAIIFVSLILVICELSTPQSSEVIGKVVTVSPYNEELLKLKNTTQEKNLNQLHDLQNLSTFTTLVYPIDRVLYKPNFDAKSYQESREEGKYIYIVSLYDKNQQEWLNFQTHKNQEENQEENQETTHERLYVSTTPYASMSARFIFIPVWGKSNLFTLWTLQGPWVHQVDIDENYGWYCEPTLRTCCLMQKQGQSKILKGTRGSKFQVIVEEEKK